MVLKVFESLESKVGDTIIRLYEKFNGPKELVWADGNHFDYYDSPTQIDNAVQNVTRFFNQYLS